MNVGVPWHLERSTRPLHPPFYVSPCLTFLVRFFYVLFSAFLCFPFSFFLWAPLPPFAPPAWEASRALPHPSACPRPRVPTWRHSHPTAPEPYSEVRRPRPLLCAHPSQQHKVPAACTTLHLPLTGCQKLSKPLFPFRKRAVR